LSLEVTVQQRGIDLRILADKFQGPIPEKLVRRLADYAYAGMKAKAPVKTGRLLGSIEKRVSGSQAKVGPTVPYAIYVEYGTRPHDIRPVFASVLAFEVAGRMVFTPIVHHPGTRPQPFVAEAAGEARRRIPEFWEKSVKEVVGE
jgi:HK97 gp10 family phage protein